MQIDRPLHSLEEQAVKHLVGTDWNARRVCIKYAAVITVGVAKYHFISDL